MTALRLADAVAHFLYTPTMLGRRAARYKWHHRLHLIPSALVQRVCDRYERRLPDEALWTRWTCTATSEPTERPPC